MPESLPTYTWRVTLRKGGKPLKIRAAYVTEGTASGTATLAAYSPGAPLVLKDAGHKTVLVAPADQVTSVTRGRCVKAPPRMIPLPRGLEATPNQIRELQDALHAAAPGYPAKLIMLPAGSRVEENRAGLKHATRNGDKR